MGISQTDYSNYKHLIEAIVRHPPFPEKDTLVRQTRTDLLNALTVGGITLKEYGELSELLQHLSPLLSLETVSNSIDP